MKQHQYTFKEYTKTENIPDMPNGINDTTPLLTLVQRFNRSDLVIPKFQRNYRWNETPWKQSGWIESILNKNAIGVIVIYQLHNMKTEFLADGLQRLTTTSMFMKNPEQFGYTLTTKEAEDACWKFSMPFQKRWYNNHFEAMKAFWNLNNGTAMTPFEYHKGALELDEVANIIVSEVPKIIDKIQYNWVSIKNHNGSKYSLYTRDCFGLFYQYISGYNGTNYWNVSKRQTDIEKSIEKKIVNYINENNITEDRIRELFNNFEDYLNIIKQNVISCQLDANKSDMLLTEAVCRWLLHLGIYRRNTQKNGFSVDKYKDLVTNVIRSSDGNKNINTKIVTGKYRENGTEIKVNLHTPALTGLNVLCETFGIQLFPKRIKKQETKKGIHHSHIKPFSKHGEGETVMEDALTNMSRGAKPIE